jgi:TRAP transporter TAXI family solute receptor
MRDWLRVYLPILLLVIAGFVLAYSFLDPLPPRVMTIAAGNPDGTYFSYAQRYRDLLEKDGITLNIRATSGSVENIELLSDPASGVDVAFVQSGTGDPTTHPNLVSLASLYYEPLWIVVGEPAPSRFSELAGKRLAAGSEGSGTRAIALQLLADNGIDAAGVTLLPAGPAEGAALLRSGAADAVLQVGAALHPELVRLIGEPGYVLMDFDRAAAYARRHRYLSAIAVPEGMVDLATNIPARTIALLAPTATLAARDDIRSAHVDALLRAADSVHRAGGLFEATGEFPSPDYVDFPLNSDAERFFESGPTFLRRFLPLWVALQVERLWILILPLLTLAIPLLRIAPPLYSWQVRRRIYRWYENLRSLERRGRQATTDEERAAIAAALDALQAEVGNIEVPLSYAESLFHLRLHIEFVKRRVSAPMDPGGAHMPVATAPEM